MTLIAPSILAADFARMGEEVTDVVAAGADWIHVDVMDGHFVPNLTLGPAMVAAIRPLTRAVIDVHLMVAPVDSFIEPFVRAGADRVTVHVEAGPHINRTLQLVRALGVPAGVAVNPGTSLTVLEPILDDIDLVLVMSVNPGFGGQAFLPGSVARVREVRRMLGERQVLIEVDGGVQAGNAGDLIAAGADVLVAGSSVFGGGTREIYAKAMEALRG